MLISEFQILATNNDCVDRYCYVTVIVTWVLCQMSRKRALDRAAPASRVAQRLSDVKVRSQGHFSYSSHTNVLYQRAALLTGLLGHHIFTIRFTFNVDHCLLLNIHFFTATQLGDTGAGAPESEQNRNLSL